MRPRSIGLCLCLLFMLSRTCTAAQSGAALTGLVTDQNGAVVEGAVVEARGLESGRTASTKTDSSGKYELGGLEPGDYRVSVNRAGFAASAKSIRLRAAATAGADFLLVPGVIEDSVTVTAGRGNTRPSSDTPQSVTVVTANEIESRRSASVMQALERVPNLLAIGANPLAARPRLRGLSSNRLLLVVDGERLNNVRSDPFSGISPAVIDVTQLESAEVLAGAGSSLRSRRRLRRQAARRSPSLDRSEACAASGRVPESFDARVSRPRSGSSRKVSMRCSSRTRTSLRRARGSSPKSARRSQAGIVPLRNQGRRRRRGRTSSTSHGARSSYARKSVTLHCMTG